MSVLGGGLLVGLLALVLFLLRPRARRRRALAQAGAFLEQGAWPEALARVEALASGGGSAAWLRTVQQAHARCHRAAGAAALQERQYENALAHLRRAAELDAQPRMAADRVVAQAVLNEVRSHFARNAAVPPAHTGELVALAQRLDPSCGEAAFWRALCCVRAGDEEQAIHVLRGLADPTGGPALHAPGEAASTVDPLLYLGGLLLRHGEPRQALRVLTEANRLYGNCPFVLALLGTAIAACGGDAGLAARALQRALGGTGLDQWKGDPARAWAQGLPESSYVRRLASEYPYDCPVWGADAGRLRREARQALGEALVRLGQMEEAVNAFEQLLQEGAPSASALRGLGLALARLERYDLAFKHLRAACELAPDDRLVVGHLALCAVRGKPLRPEDRLANAAWAVALVGRQRALGQAEWVSLLATVLAEARAAGAPIAVADLVNLCEHLLSVSAADAHAAQAFAELHATEPSAVRPEYAWLYCRAMEQKAPSGAADLGLFERTFAEEAAARAFFEARGWDFEPVAYAYLALAAEQQPGQFPAAMGAEAPTRGQALLRQRIESTARTGRADQALAAAEVWCKLAPAEPEAHDTVARLHYHAGNVEAALAALEKWNALEPLNPLPRLRQSVILHQRGEAGPAAAVFDQALSLSPEKDRPAVAFLGARLKLADLLKEGATAVAGGWQQALGLLEQCLRAEPTHADALWSAAAIRAALGDRPGLAAQAPAMQAAGAAEPRYHLMTAVCRLAAGDLRGAAEAAQRAAADPPLAPEAAYLQGLAALGRDDRATAALLLQRTAQVPGSPSAEHAAAQLGTILMRQGRFAEAVARWRDLSAQKCQAWSLTAAQADAAFLAGLDDLRQSRFAEGASHLREAGKLGRHDPGLPGLLFLALWQAGLQQMNGPKDSAAPDDERAADFLEQAVRLGTPDSDRAAYLLALAYKRQGKRQEARAALRRIEPSNGAVHLQLGLLAMTDGYYAEAAEQFQQAWALEPSSYAAAYNLLWACLAAGEAGRCATRVPQIVPLAEPPSERRLVIVLASLLSRTAPVTDAVAVSRPAEPGLPMGNGSPTESVFAGMTEEEERLLVDGLRFVRPVERAHTLLAALAEARPASGLVRQALVDVVLAEAKRLADLCQWADAGQLLRPLVRATAMGKGAPAPARTRAALLNLQGLCDCMTQDFRAGAEVFGEALKVVGDDLWLQQNLALAHEQLGRLEQADLHWRSYFSLLEEHGPAPEIPDYRSRLAYEASSRIAELLLKRDKWAAALPHLLRAQRLRPDDVETLERLFQVYVQAGRPEDASRCAAELRRIRPGDGQYELYELDLRELRGVDDMDRLFGDIRRVLDRHPGDLRAQERATVLVDGGLARLRRLCDQYGNRLERVVEQVRRLPSYQVNWPTVDSEIRTLQREFHKLRRVTQKALPTVVQAGHQRVLQELNEFLDSKLAVCQALEG